MPRALRIVAPALLALPLLGGCGSSFKLPTESTNRVIPGEGTYGVQATWTGMNGIRDILLTQGSGTQLFLLFNHGGTGPASRGEVHGYARLAPGGTPQPIAGLDFPTLFNPIALCAGGNRVFVLDQGDTCLARTNPATGTCDSTGGWGQRITDLSKYWRVREFGLLGGDTISTFTDTTVASVNGVAADAQGRVYVSGLAVILLPDQNDPRILTRLFAWRIRRYERGPRYPGVVPADRNMPGANWHRDTTWVAEEGSGIGTVVDPRGIFWSAAGGNALYVCDFGKNWVQKLDETQPSAGYYYLDGGLSGQPFNGPLDVAVDLAGYLYIADTGNLRVVRYAPDPAYVQEVNIGKDAQGQTLQDPVTVAADDSLVFVGDAALGKVIRYERRK